MSAFLKKNWKFLAGLTCVAGVCIVFVLIFNFLNSSSKISKVTDGSSYGLPASVTLETPIMYDLVNGSLGLNENYVDMVEGNKAFIATKPDENVCYVSYLQYNEYSPSNIQKYLPRFSPAPVTYTFDNGSQKNNFFQYLTNDLKDNIEVVQEGDYTFYIVDYEKMLNEVGKNTDFSWDYIANNYKAGKMQEAIDNGIGIPTYIIREKCDLEALKNHSKCTDFTNSFWDTNNYGERLKCYKKGSKADYIVLSPDFTHETSDSPDWYPTYSINNTIMSPGGSLEAIDQALSEHGFESISDAVARQEYTSVKKGTVSLYD